MASNDNNYSINIYNTCDLINTAFDSFICCLCNKIAIDIYSRVCSCKYCKVCLDYKLTIKSHECDGMKTKQCQEITMDSLKSYFDKDDNADKRLMNLVVPCCFCNEYRDKLKSISDHLDNCPKRNIDIVVKSKLAEFEKKFEKLENNVNDILEKRDKNYSDLKENVDKITFKLKDINTSVIHSGNYFLLKIESISKLIEEDEGFFSDTFYTKEMYNMGVSFYADGVDDESKGYFSLYLQIIKGKYDDILIWPYPFKLKFELVNLIDANKSYVKTIIPNKELRSFAKPINELNTLIGFAKFIQADSTTDFVKNDSIYIKFYTNI